LVQSGVVSDAGLGLERLVDKGFFGGCHR